MAVQIEIEDAESMLSSLGFAPPDTLLELYLAQANSLSEKFANADYMEATQKLIMLYLVAIFAISSGARRIASESSASGASRSFNYADDVAKLKAAIKGLDPLGIADDLLPQDKKTGLFVVVEG
ncbi:MULTISPECIES: DUF7370 family protein [Haemophilus]|uniref:DUF7370 family protein n=1 Tax=Haemophilus TaxID=724 RepID=UPI00066C020E|nr:MULTISPECIES: hypothetical protein [Haemophilus]DAV09198.1 MAG TPA: head to tail adaptor [Caudoviricetes sp.]